MKTIGWIRFIGTGLFCSILLLHWQPVLRAQTAPPDSIVQATADAQGLTQISRDALPKYGTYWLVLAGAGGAIAAPMPCPPSDTSQPIFQVADGQFIVDATAGRTGLTVRQVPTQAAIAGALEAQANAVVNLITQIQASALRQQMRTMMGAMGMNAPMPGDGIDWGGSGSATNFFIASTFDTNLLWLEITNVAGGWTYLNLHNATNQVYAIWGTTNLLAGWQVQTELWPTDTNCQPFAIPTLDRQNLFLRAQDWTDFDSNADGIPDWWIWKYFGTLTPSASDLDPQGNTLLTDYQNFTNGITPSDPNIIQFTLTTPKLYVTSTAVDMQMNVTAGTPAYYALQLSGQTTTNWLPFTTPNLASNLGATDGVYVVSVGLRGLPADAAETWASIAFTRDTTPPIVTLTNLASLTGSRPFIDPAGFVPKALSSLRYTVVDANGVTNSRSGCVTAQGLSLNDPYHVANSFQCVDLALALGVNQISIQAVDWAGNVAMTNFAYVFDTNGDITPPAINVTWPPSGTLISGDSFTVQGNLDDDTATASLQYLDTNGILQTINGLVERGGNLWVQNVPLVAGTNNFTVTATDAAGNMSTNNINVVQSSLSLVITPLTTEAMNCGYAMVTGTVDDPDATIIVNGIPGTNYYGNWEVDNVPLPPGGTVTLLATVQPLEGPATEIDLEQDRKSVVFTQTYGNNLNGSEDGNGSAYGSHGHFEEQGKLEWARGVGGTNWGTAYSTNYDTGESSYDETVTIWPADKGYLPTLKGIQIISGFWIPASYGLPETVYQYTNEVDPPTVEWMEKAEVSMNGCFRDSFGNSVGSYGFSVASCRTVGLFTGSKALRQGQSLFDLNTTLVEKSGLTINPSHPLNVGWGGMPGTSLLGETIRDVPPDRIFLDAVGRLGSDGQLWTVQPRDLEIAITPIVAGGSAEGVSAAFKVSTNPPTTSDASRTPINGALPGAPDFELTIKANSITLSKHVVAAGADFCVGQKVQFELSAFPDGVTATNFQWVLDGSFVNDHAQSNSDSSDNYFENRDLLSNPIITNCWWVSGGFNPPSTYNAKYSCTLLFTNGNPSQSNSATGLFNMYKPEGKITTKTTSVGIYPYQNSWQGIFFNSYSGPGIIFSNSISYGLGFPDSGIVEWVQVDFSPVIKLLTTNSILHTNLQSGFGPYGDEPIPYNTFLPGTFVPVDTPAIKLPNGNEYERGEGSAVFEMWMMFHPGGGIAVPLRAVIWSWSGSATNSIDPVLGWNTWSLEHGTNSIDPPDFPTESFPIWNSHVANFQMNPAVNYR